MIKIKFCLLLVSLLAIISCNNTASSAFQEYKSDNAHFSMQFSKKWHYDTSTNTLRQDLDSDVDSYQEKIVWGVEKLPMKLDAKTYSAGVLMQYKLLDTQLQQISAQPFAVANMDGFKTIFVSKNNDAYIKSGHYILIKDSVAYTFQCQSTDADFAAHESGFDSIIKTIQYIP
jgi:hypothetical protein